jgi:hypothetical protein
MNTPSSANTQEMETFYVERSIQDLMDFHQCMDCEVLATDLLALPHRAQVTTTLQATLKVRTTTHQADPPLHIANAVVVHHRDPNLPVKVDMVIQASKSQAPTLASLETSRHYLPSSPTPEPTHPGFPWYKQHHFHGA